MLRSLLKMKAVPSSAAFCNQLITMGIPVGSGWFSSSSLTLPKALATTDITVALIFHPFCSCNLKSWYLMIFSSSFTLISRNGYVDDFTFSLVFINNYNVWPSVFYFLICLDCKVPKYFTFLILQHWLSLMRESFVFTFNFKFLAQETVYFFPKFIVSLPVLSRTDKISDTFNFLIAEPAQREHILVINAIFYCIWSEC